MEVYEADINLLCIHSLQHRNERVVCSADYRDGME